MSRVIHMGQHTLLYILITHTLVKYARLTDDEHRNYHGNHDRRLAPLEETRGGKSSSLESNIRQHTRTHTHCKFVTGVDFSLWIFDQLVCTQ
jgi:hypothetical protein